MEQVLYHVVHDGRKVGPYDRRTVVGMRIKKTLSSDDMLMGTDGCQLSVGELIARHRPFHPEHSGSYSIVQATYTAGLTAVDAKLLQIPAFRGETELRVQAGVLRISGRSRQGFGWKEQRIKLLLADVLHARVRGTQADLWFKPPEGTRGPLQRITLELFSAEAAGEFVDWLPAATAWPQAHGGEAAPVADSRYLWMAAMGIAGVVVVLGAVLVLTRH